MTRANQLARCHASFDAAAEMAAFGAELRDRRARIDALERDLASVRTRFAALGLVPEPRNRLAGDGM